MSQLYKTSKTETKNKKEKIYIKNKIREKLFAFDHEPYKYYNLKTLDPCAVLLSRSHASTLSFYYGAIFYWAAKS